MLTRLLGNGEFVSVPQVGGQVAGYLDEGQTKKKKKSYKKYCGRDKQVSRAEGRKVGKHVNGQLLSVLLFSNNLCVCFSLVSSQNAPFITYVSCKISKGLLLLNQQLIQAAAAAAVISKYLLYVTTTVYFSLFFLYCYSSAANNRCTQLI